MSTLNDELVWRIYPNPTASAITININIPVEAAIYNVTGSLVKSFNFTTFENVIDLSDLIPAFTFSKQVPGTPDH
ncbi:MAG: T9SS type A sorting domain-containing protein [Bacteroidetes bacterium]|nr:T9SS type A sorting domain-containing protein [Bacteroidota bacterium]